MIRLRIPLLIVLLFPFTATAAQRVELDEPLKVATQKTDGDPISGELIAYDQDAFELRTRSGELQRVVWDQIHPRNVFLLHRRAFGNDVEPEQWLELGRRLLALEKGERWADQAFLRAKRLDPSLAEAIEQARDQSAPHSDPGEATDASADPSPFAWPTLTDDQQAEAVDDLKAFAAEARERVTDGLTLYETKYFLLSTDLSRAEAMRWQGLLDKMYALLLKTFALPPDHNIWRGKALVFVFQTRDDFRKYEREMEKNEPPEWAGGMCHGKANGEVHIAFYRSSEDPKRFAHTLVHESVHGFVHRYRSRRHVPSWVNEGLAEWIAYQLVPRPAHTRGHKAALENTLKQHGGLGDMLREPRIEPWQYRVTYVLTEFMISKNKKGYGAFVKAIKDGGGWEEALEQHYGTSLQRLVAAFGNAVDVPGLEP